MKTKNLNLLIMALILAVSFTSCGKDDIDYGNIENLYEQPLPVIQKAVQGKWKWYVSYGGVVGISYSDDTFVDINDDHVIIDYADGSQRTFYFTWEKLTPYNLGHETYVMWDKERNEGLWYFSAIKNDSLGVGSYPPSGSTFWQFSFGFARIK